MTTRRAASSHAGTEHPRNLIQRVSCTRRLLFALAGIFLCAVNITPPLHAATGVPCDPPPSGIIGWWAGDGNANDLTGANNGILEGGAVATAAGMVGDAFGFDGTNAYVEVPNSAALNPTNFTVEAWVLFSSLDSAGSGGSPAGYQYIVFKQNTLSGNFEGLDLCKARTTTGDVFRFVVSSASGQTAEISSPTLISTGVWYHVAAVRGTNFLQLYLNGQLVSQTNVTFSQNYGTLPLYFGTSGQSYWDHKFAGMLDEVTLDDRPLAASEISAIYAAGSAGKCKSAGAPVISSQPQSQTVAAGANVSFTVTAAGTAPMSYQWAFNGVPILGASNTSLTMSDVQSAQAGNYVVTVSNSAGSVESTAAALVVAASGGCDTPPSGMTDWWTGDGNASDLIGGNTGALEGGATATAAGFVGEAFSFDGTNSYVQIPNSAALDPAVFTLEAWVRFSSLNSAGSGGSPAGDQYIVFKQNSSTWSFEGIDLSKTRTSSGDVFRFLVTSASGASEQLNSVTTISAGVWYHVAAVRGSNYTQLYVNGQLENQATVTFAQNYGTLPLYFGTSGESYWDHKLAGNLDEVSLYNRPLASNEIAAIYAAGSAGKCKNVSTQPAIITQPASQTVATGGSASFSVTASGAAPLNYQWRFNSSALSGATNAVLMLANVQAAQAGNYTVVVANSAGSVTSSVAVLTISTGGSPPVITTQPVSQSVASGASVSFSVSASGAAPLAYQWAFNGANLSGATASSLTISDAQPANAGNYAVVVSDAAGSTTSASASLTVVPPSGSVTINGAVTYQTIDGFGANINHRSWNSDGELEPVLNALIHQAGFTLFHVIFDNNNWEQTNDNDNANVMNWTYYNSIYNSADFQKLWGIMAYLNQQGITNGLVPDFEGPVALWMGGLSLASGMENEYAETIASLLLYARTNQNLQFTVVGPVNEPDWTYSGINLSGPAQYVTVMHDLAVQLDNYGLSDIRFSGPDLAITDTSWLTQIMTDPLIMSKMAHFGLHSYSADGEGSSGVASVIEQSAYPAEHFWMTEYNEWCADCQSSVGGDDSWDFAMGTVTYLLAHLANGASAGIVWEGYDSKYYPFNSSTGGNDPAIWSFWGLFGVNNTNASPLTYTARPGFYALAQIALYVRPGAQRIDVNSSSSPLTMLAFYNTNNAQFTLTGANTTSSASTLSCVLESLPAIPSLAFYYTSASTNLCYAGQVAVNNGAFSAVVPANCVFTLTYSNAAAQVALGGAAPPAAGAYFLTPVAQNGAISLTLSGTPGSVYQIEASSNLVDWVAVTNITCTNGLGNFTDMNAGSYSQRFYRAVPAD